MHKERGTKENDGPKFSDFHYTDQLSCAQVHWLKPFLDLLRLHRRLPLNFASFRFNKNAINYLTYIIHFNILLGNKKVSQKVKMNKKGAIKFKISQKGEVFNYDIRRN